MLKQARKMIKLTLFQNKQNDNLKYFYVLSHIECCLTIWQNETETEMKCQLDDKDKKSHLLFTQVILL